MDKIELKASLAIDDAGTVTGVAWPYGAGPDRVGDIITKGAFAFPVTPTPMLYQHDPADLCGTWDEVAETDEGLMVKGKLHLDHPRSRAVHSLVKGGLITGLSIGFKTKASQRVGSNRIISQLDLFEVSLVASPAHAKARVTSTKSAAAAIALAEAINRAAAALKA